jgi:hypothetical protein
MALCPHHQGDWEVGGVQIHGLQGANTMEASRGNAND